MTVLDCLSKKYIHFEFLAHRGNGILRHGNIFDGSHAHRFAFKHHDVILITQIVKIMSDHGEDLSFDGNVMYLSRTSHLLFIC